MSTDIHAVTVLKVKGDTAELELRSLIEGDPVDLWPTLVLRVLEEGAGSALAGERVYDDDWVAENLDRVFQRIELVKRSRDGGAVTLRVVVRDPRTLAHLRKGASWGTTAYPTDDAAMIDAAWTADGKAVLVARDVGAATLYAVSSKGLGAVKATLNHWGVLTVDAHPGGALLTAGRGVVRLWDAKGAKVTRELVVGEGLVAARFLGDDVALAFADGRLALLDATGATLAEADAGAAVTSLAVHGDRVAAGCADGAVALWGPRGGGLSRLAAHDGPVRDVALSAAGLATAGDTRVRHFDSAGEPVATWTHTSKSSYALYSASVAPQGDEVLFTAGPGVVVMRLDTGEITELDDAFAPHQLTWSDSGALRIAERHGPWEVGVWDRAGEVVLRVAAGPLSLHRTAHGYDRTHAAVSPDDRFLALPVQPKDYRSLTLEVLGLAEPGRVKVPWPKADYDFFTDLEFLDGRRVMISGANHGSVVATTDGEVLSDTDRRVDFILRCPDGSGRVLVSKGRVVSVLDAELNPLATFDAACPYSLNVLAWTGDGQRVVAGAANTLFVWEPTSGASWKVEQPGGLDVNVSLSACGRWMLAQQPYDHAERVFLWDLHERRVAATVKSPKWAPVMAHHPDGFTLGWAEHLTRFDRQGKEVRTFKLPPPVTVTHAPRSVSMADDGRVASVADKDSQLRVSHTKGQSPVRAAWDRVSGVVASPDGKRVLTLCGWRCGVVEMPRGPLGR